MRKLLGGSPSEFALLKSHPDEPFFGVQLADNKPDTLAEGARLAESRGARFVDLNCGCPIHEITRRGLGASLLRKPARLGRLVGGDGPGGEGAGHREAARRLERGRGQRVAGGARVRGERRRGDHRSTAARASSATAAPPTGTPWAAWRPSAPCR